LIHTSWGGTVAETWTSTETIAQDPDFSEMLTKLKSVDMNAAKVNPNTYPTLLYNGMINPIVPYGIRGAIWYQGESNASRAQQYKRVFPNMIKDWRTKWNQGKFPFLFVQLANYTKPVSQPAESEWAELREAQTQTLGVENTGMATIIDVGDADNIHPTDKQTVGYRLSLAARKVAYGETLVYTGPTYKEMKIDKNKISITFDNVGKGLQANNKYGYINGFTIAAKDGNFKWAKATIVNENTIVVTSEAIDNPAEVRYGWANNPDDLNLYNVEGLPANPFRTDSRPGITK
jgi:sialate O-acetylesterase